MTNLIRPVALVDLAAAFARMGRPSSNRARRGLYAGKDVLFGNKVSHSNRKTRRMFKPNAHHKRLWSDTLQDMIPFYLTTTTLRMVDKVGGLDNYLLQTPDHKLDSESGIKVKRRIENIKARSDTIEKPTAASSGGEAGGRRGGERIG
uniref:Large ribosomal subunit protein bL28c n=1 Tax=Nannochloropsis gaditana (strain CCMP526) TaxID=1093141 RepID=I2CRI6_NANGC